MKTKRFFQEIKTPFFVFLILQIVLTTLIYFLMASVFNNLFNQFDFHALPLAE